MQHGDNFPYTVGRFFRCQHSSPAPKLGFFSTENSSKVTTLFEGISICPRGAKRGIWIYYGAFVLLCQGLDGFAEQHVAAALAVVFSAKPHLIKIPS